jgi:hypothetical protein
MTAPSAGPPAKLDDYRSASYQTRPAAPAPPVSYPPTVYQEHFPVSAPRYPLAGYQQPPVPVAPHHGAVTQSGQRVRGMNAAMETGVAGVGEMAPARQPVRPRQMVLAVLMAAVGLVAGVLTYRSLASGPVSFSGEVNQMASQLGGQLCSALPDRGAGHRTDGGHDGKHHPAMICFRTTTAVLAAATLVFVMATACLGLSTRRASSAGQLLQDYLATRDLVDGCWLNIAYRNQPGPVALADQFLRKIPASASAGATACGGTEPGAA